MYFITCLHCVQAGEWMTMMMTMMMMVCRCFLPGLFLCESHWQGAGLPSWTDLLWTNELLLWGYQPIGEWLGSLAANELLLWLWAHRTAILFVYGLICYGKWACVRGRGRAGDSHVTSSPRDRRAHTHTHTYITTHSQPSQGNWSTCSTRPPAMNIKTLL